MFSLLCFSKGRGCYVIIIVVLYHLFLLLYKNFILGKNTNHPPVFRKSNWNITFYLLGKYLKPCSIPFISISDSDVTVPVCTISRVKETAVCLPTTVKLYLHTHWTTDLLKMHNFILIIQFALWLHAIILFGYFWLMILVLSTKKFGLHKDICTLRFRQTYPMFVLWFVNEG